MEEKSTGVVDKGYPVVEATIYIYCDVCGSFNIKFYIPFIKLLITAIIISVGAFVLLKDKQWLPCLIPIFLFSLHLPWRDIFLRYKCRKCGNVHIAQNNSLHYQPYDLSVVDVPDHLTQKRYTDTDVVHFHLFT